MAKKFLSTFERYYTKCQMERWHLSSFYRWENWRTQTCTDLPKVTQQVSRGTRGLHGGTGLAGISCHLEGRAAPSARLSLLTWWWSWTVFTTPLTCSLWSRSPCATCEMEIKYIFIPLHVAMLGLPRLTSPQLSPTQHYLSLLSSFLCLRHFWGMPTMFQALYCVQGV